MTKRAVLVTTVLLSCLAIVVNASPASAAPGNDAFSAASVLSGAVTTTSGSTVGATHEAGEPAHADRDTRTSVWYRWTATISSPVRIAASSQTADLIVAVYTGQSVSGLTLVAARDDDPYQSGVSSVQFQAVRGTTYRIAVDGFAGSTGAFGLRVGPGWTPYDDGNAPLFAGQLFVDLTGRDEPSASESQAVDAWLNGSTATTDFVEQVYGWNGAGPTAEPVVRLYRAYFLRDPDLSGLRYWISRRRSGTTLAVASSNFASSSEFKRRYGTLNDSQFIDRIYLNVLGRTADPGGKSYWSKRLSEGYSRGRLVLSFSESSENIRKTGPRVGVVTRWFLITARVVPSADLASVTAAIGNGAALNEATGAGLRSGSFAAHASEVEQAGGCPCGI